MCAVHVHERFKSLHISKTDPVDVIRFITVSLPIILELYLFGLIFLFSLYRKNLPDLLRMLVVMLCTPFILFS